MVTQDHQSLVIAVLGLGEAGSVIARDLTAAGTRVRGYAPAVTATGPVLDTTSEAEAAHEAAVRDRARKLEQIKDLYLTAEAIGEANVDKHFDQLLAQQRELISGYFRQPGSAGLEAAGVPAAGADSPQAGPAGVADQAETEPDAPRVPGPPPPGPEGPSEGAGVTADRPRAW